MSLGVDWTTAANVAQEALLQGQWIHDQVGRNSDSGVVHQEASGLVAHLKMVETSITVRDAGATSTNVAQALTLNQHLGADIIAIMDETDLTTRLTQAGLRVRDGLTTIATIIKRGGH